MSKKILGLVGKCGACPNYGYYSGGEYRCNLVDQPVRNPEVVALFCPLADYPARTIAQLEATVAALQAQLELGLANAILTYLAARLKCVLSVSGSGLDIRLSEEQTVVLRYTHILRICVAKGEIEFEDGGPTYILHPDQSPPLLRELVSTDPERTWRHHELKV